ncbi:MAG: methyltransferase domain-containing protein [bacterium]|nr:methyltransferase domain-containing protein [bacterium]
MYSLAAYGAMLAEPVRRQAYVDALEASVRPGCVVLEIGTGPGVFALLAARLGARKVYAVEPADSIEVARQLAAVHGLANRIELVQGYSTELELLERVDVIVSDLRGVLPLAFRHLPSIIDARQRLLVPGGELVPRQDTLWACVVEAEKAWDDLTLGWRQECLGLDLDVPLGIVTNTWTKARFAEDQCLVEPRCWATLDYRTIETTDAAADLAWELESPGRAHGLAVWFETTLSAAGGFSNAPGGPELIYGQGFFPFPRPVDLEPGDLLKARIEAKLVADDYVWRWSTSIEGAAGSKARFEQSTFHGTPLSLAKLRKRAASYLPRLDAEGRVLLFILARLERRTPLGEIAGELQESFPERFERRRDALARVAEVAEKYA